MSCLPLNVNFWQIEQNTRYLAMNIVMNDTRYFNQVFCTISENLIKFSLFTIISNQLPPKSLIAQNENKDSQQSTIVIFVSDIYI